MCRNIRPLFNFEPPATDAEIRDAALQFVRKIGGCTKPSKANEALFDESVEAIAAVGRKLIDGMVTNAPPRDREEEKKKARARWEKRQARIRAG